VGLRSPRRVDAVLFNQPRNPQPAGTLAPERATGLSQTFRDQCASCMRGRYDPTFGYELGLHTPVFLSIVGSMQVRQSATSLQIVRGKTLRQARATAAVSIGSGPLPRPVSDSDYLPSRDAKSVSSDRTVQVYPFKRTAPKGRFSSALKIIRKPDGQPRPACFRQDRADKRGTPHSDARPAGPRLTCRHWRRRPCARLRPVSDRRH
jgi:hypothetical protein